MSVQVRPVRVPERLGTPGAVEFEAYAALGFELERANWGHDHFAETVGQLLAFHHNDAHRGRALFGAWDGDSLVGRAGFGWERVPAGGLTIDEERWDAPRVREHEAEELDGDTSVLVAAAVTDVGDVAGYTELELPRGRGFAYQYDTLVVGAHRGHGLGMLVKLANLVRLADVAPERSVVYTWNASENAHMLAINVALGFRRCGLEAVWQRADDVDGADVNG